MTFADKRFAFLMFPGFEELDLIGPWEMATMWNAYADGPSCFSLSQDGAPIKCAKGLSVTPDHAFQDSPAFDYLLVPGGFTALEEMKNPAMLAFLKESAATSKAVLSVCTGSLMLHAAGLLDSRKATTNWKFLAHMAELDGVELVQDRYVHDGPIWTSAGVSAGMDMLLGFIAHMAGEQTASVVQNNAEYYPDPFVYGTEAYTTDVADYVRRMLPPAPTPASAGAS
ncbi:MAG: DJ-1/PfpI family protein [Devosiaceae bacterium]|nr:DJ-1/PfpI family protein [Devosiaceae bacterium MH13]